jgi:hypothetical protein
VTPDALLHAVIQGLVSGIAFAIVVLLFARWQDPGQR